MKSKILKGYFINLGVTLYMDLIFNHLNVFELLSVF
jgi:hypothetical protein